jgi:hypothetical protein
MSSPFRQPVANGADSAVPFIGPLFLGPKFRLDLVNLAGRARHQRFEIGNLRGMPVQGILPTGPTYRSVPRLKKLGDAAFPNCGIALGTDERVLYLRQNV